MKVLIVHPITHDGITYGRGVHELDDTLGKFFCDIVDAEGRLVKSAIPFEESDQTATVTRAVDAPKPEDEAKKEEDQQQAPEKQSPKKSK